MNNPLCPNYETCEGIMNPRHHEGDLEAPEADWWVCPECGHETEPE